MTTLLSLLVLLYIVLHFGYDWVVCLWNRRQARLNREDVEFVRGCCNRCCRIDLKAGN